MSTDRVESDVTIVVFKDQTDLSVFDDDEDAWNFIIKHRDGLSYDEAVKEAYKKGDDRGMNLIAEYTEINEFGDPVTCLFFRWK